MGAGEPPGRCTVHMGEGGGQLASNLPGVNLFWPVPAVYKKPVAPKKVIVVEEVPQKVVVEKVPEVIKVRPNEQAPQQSLCSLLPHFWASHMLHAQSPIAD